MTLGKTPRDRLSQQYIDGVNSFLTFAMTVVDRSGKILCPCIDCLNCYQQFANIMQIHLLHHEIMQDYTKWYYHEESRELNEHIDDEEMSDNDHLDGIDALVEDRIRGEPRDTTQQDEEVRNFDKMFSDSKHELYPGCTNYTLLKFVIEMLNVKVTTNLSNKGLDIILDLLSKILLKGNLIPRSTYETRS